MKIQKYLKYIQEKRSINQQYEKFQRTIGSNKCDDLWLNIDQLSDDAVRYTPEVPHPINVNFNDKRIPEELKRRYKKMKLAADQCDKREKVEEIKKCMNWLKGEGLRYCSKTKNQKSCQEYIKRKLKIKYDQLRRAVK